MEYARGYSWWYSKSSQPRGMLKFVTPRQQDEFFFCASSRQQSTRQSFLWAVNFERPVTYVTLPTMRWLSHPLENYKSNWIISLGRGETISETTTLPNPWAFIHDGIFYSTVCGGVWTNPFFEKHARRNWITSCENKNVRNHLVN